MQTLDLEEFEREAARYDAAVLATPGIDRFCSASEWILAAHAAWTPEDGVWIRRGEHGWAVLLEHVDALGIKVLLGLDSMWGFACPLAGEPAGLAAEFSRACQEEEWHVLVLTGLRAGSPLFAALRARFDGYELRRGPELRRWVASLEGGLDRYLARRSGKLRGNLRRAARRARDAGIDFQAGGDEGVDEILLRILDVEMRSWKGPPQTGMLTGDMYDFYKELAVRLAARGRLRVLFARRDGTDVGYILGGVRGGIYRGFQFSFDDRFRALSLGGLLQLKQIEALCAEGVATYDLGMDMGYKRRWADEPSDTVTLAVIRR